MRHTLVVPPRYTVDFGTEQKTVEGVDLEGAGVELRGPHHKENVYLRHHAREHWGDPSCTDDPAHPDGCQEPVINA